MLGQPTTQGGFCTPGYSWYVNSFPFTGSFGAQSRLQRMVPAEHELLFISGLTRLGQTSGEFQSHLNGLFDLKLWEWWMCLHMFFFFIWRLPADSLGFRKTQFSFFAFLYFWCFLASFPWNRFRGFHQVWLFFTLMAWSALSAGIQLYSSRLNGFGWGHIAKRCKFVAVFMCHVRHSCKCLMMFPTIGTVKRLTSFWR